MTRTKRIYMAHWSVGGSPYEQIYSKKFNQRNTINIRIRVHQGKDELTANRTYKRTSLSQRCGELFGGKWSIKALNEVVFMTSVYPRQRIGKNRKINDLVQAAKKQLARRGRLGVFEGHKNKLHLYKRELTNQHLEWNYLQEQEQCHQS